MLALYAPRQESHTGLLLLPRLLPAKIASEIVLTGDVYPASLLAHHDLINRIVPSGEALKAALEYARKIAANGPLAVAVSKQVLETAQDWSLAEMFDHQNELTTPVLNSADAREGAGLCGKAHSDLAGLIE